MKPNVAVSTIMTELTHVAAPEQTLDEARDLMSVFRFRHLPVCEGEVLVGIISEVDLDNAPTSHNVRQAMTAKPTTITADASVRDAVEALRDTGFNSLPVVDAEGKLVGLITSTDLDPYMNEDF